MQTRIHTCITHIYRNGGEYNVIVRKKLWRLIFLFITYFMPMYVCECRHPRATATLEVRGQLSECVLSCHLVGPENQTQVIRPACKLLCLKPFHWPLTMIIIVCACACLAACGRRRTAVASQCPSTVGSRNWSQGVRLKPFATEPSHLLNLHLDCHLNSI